MKEDNNTIHILITATDYAKRHKVSRVAVNNWIKEGRIRAVFVGAAWLIEDVIELDK